MAGEVLRMKLIAKFELYALYQWQCCNAATTPSPEPLYATFLRTRNMIKTYVIAFFLFLNIKGNGQKYSFSPEGSMTLSSFHIDTVIKTRLRLTNQIVFKKIDSSFADSTKFRIALGKKLDRILSDAHSFFLIVNLTNTNLNLRKLNNHLVAEELAKDEDFNYKPISFFSYPTCGTGIDYSNLILKPQEILIIKNFEQDSDSKKMDYKTCSLRVLANQNKPLISAVYIKKVELNRFFVNDSLRAPFRLFSYRLAFNKY